MRIKEILITAEEIQDGIDRAAKWINQEYANKRPVLFGLLKGCIPFFGSLMPKLTITCTTSFMTVSSFRGGTSAQCGPEITCGVEEDFNGRDILIIEDIIDTARTLKMVQEWLLARGAKSVRFVTLLDKPTGRKVQLDADFSCFTIPEAFVVGFGLDYKEEMRNWPYIAVLEND